MRSGGAAAAGEAQTTRDQQEMARSLDRLAERIAQGVSAGDDQSRRMTEQLARTQELRERIESLTREVERLAQQRGDAGAAGDAARLRDEFARELQQTRELLEQLARENPEVARAGIGFTFEGQGMVTSAPGTEPFKQDFERWEQLRKQVTLALEQAQSALSRKLQARDARDRLAAGGDDKPPAAYEQQVDSYFKALADRKKP
jgi:DNA repair exonuclease SbcCD ATPase subunit